MLDGFLRGEERTQDVQVELLVEVLFGDAFERRGLVNSGVVEEDVEPAECPLRLGEETLDVCLLRDVCLHRNGLAASAYNLRDRVVGALHLVAEIIRRGGKAITVQANVATRWSALSLLEA